MVREDRMMSRWQRATALVLVAVGFAAPAAAQTGPAGPLPPDSSPRPDRQPPPSVLGAPIAVRGEPVEPLTEAPVESASYALPPTVIPAGANVPEPRPTRSATLAAPTNANAAPPLFVEQPVRTNQPDPVNDLLARRNDTRKDVATPTDNRSSGKFGDHLDGILGERSEWFRSDHAFDGFISPISNPFLFEDPRSLTEVRPIYIYQRMPSGQPDFTGGNISYFGLQTRVAITNRLSFTFNKLGGLWIDPGSGSTFSGENGFAELWFGPKYTFIRGEQSGCLLAGGLQFQLPIGSASVFQDTGNLSLVPYVTYGQNFLRDCRIGSFNGLIGSGYAFGTDSARSDYFYLSTHLDLDLMNWHRIYPVTELNYFLYTSDGNARPIGSEGRDLINFGGQAKGNNMLSGAIGARFKITEAAQFGAVYEMPFVGSKDLMQSRFTVDFILRY